jgi:lysophospholipase L1-like esterase
MMASLLQKNSISVALMAATLCCPCGASRAQAPSNAQKEPASARADAAHPLSAAASNCMELVGSRIDDWANLARYRQANGAVRSPAVVFMGDSITDLWTQPSFGGFFTGRDYLDRGIGGQTTSQMLLRFRQDVIALRPKAVVILAGTNDIAGNTGPMTNEDIEGNLATMAELAHAAGIKVVLASVTPVAASQFSQRPVTRIRAINGWIRSYSAENGHVYLDYFSPMSDSRGILRAGLSDDGLHPNLNGYAIMTPIAEAAIATALR